MSLNAAVGGLAAGLLQRLRGGSFGDAFARGALGGGIAYVGKRVSVERFDGAGLLGREIAAVGGSFVRNAGRDRPLLDELILPVGPVNLYIRPDSGRSVRARLDVLGAGAFVYGIARSELRFDAGASLSAGTPVFEAPEHAIRSGGTLAYGTVRFGVVLLAAQRRPTTFAHERVHVLQQDFAFSAWGDAVQRAWMDRVPYGATVGRVLDADLLPVVGGALVSVLGRESSRHWPREREAYFLDRKGQP